MSQRLSPFHFLYTAREQKMRDTIQHLIKRYGLAGARSRVSKAYHDTASLNPASPQAIWWNDVRWHIHEITSRLNWGHERGL
jgi:hypothetical protein